MRLEHNSRGLVVIVLSKRNVLSLLHKVDWESSGRMIDKLERKDGELLMGESPFVEVVVRVEPDEQHYAHDSRVVPGLAGPMHDETEVFVGNYRDICGATDPGGLCHLPFGHTGNCLMRSDRA